jgi:YD repeat-containing protein
MKKLSEVYAASNLPYEFPIVHHDADGNIVYYEDADQAYRSKFENGDEVFYEDSSGYTFTASWDGEHRLLEVKDNEGFYAAREYDHFGNVIASKGANIDIEDEPVYV